MANLAKDRSRVEDAIAGLYAGLERGDLASAEDRLTVSTYVLPGTAAPGLRGAEDVLGAVQQWLTGIGQDRPSVRLRSLGRVVALSSSGRSAWMWDSLDLERDAVAGTTPVRVSALLIDDKGWRVAAAHWSVPYASNEAQHELLKAGRIPTGTLAGPPDPEVAGLANQLVRATSEVKIADLFAPRDDVVAIGSAADEVFAGMAARQAWEEFAGYGPGLAVRGGIDGGISPDGMTAWLATHIDITFDTTAPYRFFFIWHREDDDWKLVVSHDSISIPSAPQ